MKVVARYFRQHRWQRRLLTLALAAILGVSAAWLIWPGMRDRKIVRMLGSTDSAQRLRGIRQVVQAARGRPELVARLERTLDAAGDDDNLFGAVAETLSRLGRFDTPSRRGEHLDRFWAIGLAAGGGDANVPVRLIWLHKLIVAGRDNRYVRRALGRASGDGSADVRAASAILAGRLGDDETLISLLGDDQPAVRAAAAIDAALAGRTQTIAAIAGVFRDAKTPPDRAAAAYALARLAPEKYAGEIAAAIITACNESQHDLLEKLLCAAPLLGRRAAPAVFYVLREAKRRRIVPPAMAFVAAGKAGLGEMGPFIWILVNDLIARREKLTVGEAVVLAAAVRAAGRLEMPAELFVKVLENLWHPGEPGTRLAMLAAIEALAEQAEPNDARALAVLRRAAQRGDTPIPAAAAAVAVYGLAPSPEAIELLRAACGSEHWLAGDYVAWNLAQAGRAGNAENARRAAAELFATHEYDKAVRSAGAGLWALLTRGTDQAEKARRLIEARLSGRDRGRERDPFVAGSYRCALLILGQTELAEQVQLLMRSAAFPKRRALTALVLSGQASGVDHVLGGARFDAAQADSYLTGRLMARVYAAAAADLPRIDIDAPATVRYWQGRLCRDFYLIHRRAILDRIRS